MFTKPPTNLPLLDRMAIQLQKEVNDRPWGRTNDAENLLKEYRTYRRTEVDQKLRDFFGPSIKAKRQVDRTRAAFEATKGWITLAKIADLTGDPPASVSARIRDLRKPQYGGLKIAVARIDGQIHYKIITDI